ncbi:MAG: hypothetical protein KAK00_09140 [Nanoarchaeota archaeon]|nr:hypothetical protein [Nanoarchaeota archaeon]
MKKAIITILILIILLAGSITYLYTNVIEKPKQTKEKLFFSEKAENWIYDNPSTLEEDIKIDVFMATEGKTKLEKSQQNYFIDGDLTSFFYSGMYKGMPFKSEYLPENFYNLTRGLSLTEKRKKADELTLMQITNEFNSDDGIINGFILGKKENNKLVFYIFIDEDWKSELEFTNIIWGDNFRNIEALNERQFDFSKSEQGVYIDKLETDVDWYKNDVISGGIVVGEINKGILSDLIRGIEKNVTYMMVR